MPYYSPELKRALRVLKRFIDYRYDFERCEDGGGINYTFKLCSVKESQHLAKAAAVWLTELKGQRADGFARPLAMPIYSINTVTGKTTVQATSACYVPSVHVNNPGQPSLSGALIFDETGNPVGVKNDAGVVTLFPVTPEGGV